MEIVYEEKVKFVIICSNNLFDLMVSEYLNSAFG